jgi:PhnB protein
MFVQPYLFFEGRCDEALAYYQAALGAKVNMLMRYRENPQQEYNPPASDDKIMHCSFSIGDTTLCASDGMCSGSPNFQGFSLSITVDTADEADRLFNTIADGGSVQMPIGETFYSPRFGMATDRFGVAWMVIMAPPQSCI